MTVNRGLGDRPTQNNERDEQDAHRRHQRAVSAAKGRRIKAQQARNEKEGKKK
jgi:hypothetical protein